MSRSGLDLFDHLEDQPNGPIKAIADVALNVAVDQTFSYCVPEGIWPLEPGQRVIVPFGPSDRPLTGLCTAIRQAAQSVKSSDNDTPVRLKPILRVVDPQPIVDQQLLELADWISSYYLCPIGQVLWAMVPGPVRRGVGLLTERVAYLADPQALPTQSLTPKQTALVQVLADNKAFTEQAAMPVRQLLDKAGTNAGPLAKLVAKGIIGLKTRQRIRARLLPIGHQHDLEVPSFELNPYQQQALAQIISLLDQQRFAVVLLHGVTGSGKTEVYIQAIQRVLQRGLSAIVLLPEIALTAQTMQRFSRRFGQVAVLHSGLKASQRHMQWHLVKTGQVRLVIGPRSAIFAPVERLGLVVVDEEHDASYKQDTAPRYNARDVAIKRAQLAQTLCILGSATPSVETIYNCQSRPHYQRISLPCRVREQPLPRMHLIDLRQQPDVCSGRHLISKPLAAAIEAAISRKEQAILLLNRRGYSHLVICPGCRYVVKCHNCDAAMTLHRSNSRCTAVTTRFGRYYHAGGFAICHHCLAMTMIPDRCPLCQSDMALLGFGSQRLEEELNTRFPGARVARLDSDAIRGDQVHEVLEAFAEGHLDILAGTQILAKGLDFPSVTVVGIISAETALTLSDFRSSERTFQLICQVAGRAGRADRPGMVYVQTYMPDQPAINAALRHDVEGFYQQEIRHRQACGLPPVTRMALVTLRGRSWELLLPAAQRYRAAMDKVASAGGLDVQILGPVDAPISRIQREHRLHIVVRAPDSRSIQSLFAGINRQQIMRLGATKVSIDIDPVNLM